MTSLPSFLPARSRAPNGPLLPSKFAALLGVLVHVIISAWNALPHKTNLLFQDSAQALLLSESLSTASLDRLMLPLYFQNLSTTASLTMQRNYLLGSVFPTDDKHL